MCETFIGLCWKCVMLEAAIGVCQLCYMNTEMASEWGDLRRTLETG